MFKSSDFNWSSFFKCAEAISIGSRAVFLDFANIKSFEKILQMGRKQSNFDNQKTLFKLLLEFKKNPYKFNEFGNWTKNSVL